MRARAPTDADARRAACDALLQGAALPVTKKVAWPGRKWATSEPVVWLDGLEHLPPKVVVIFTTNNPEKLTRRFLRRCEAYEFDGRTEEFRRAMEDLIRAEWHRLTGKRCRSSPRASACSIRPTARSRSA